MVRRALIAAVMALALAASPVLAASHTVNLYDGSNGGAPSCQNLTSMRSSLASSCGVNWDNRASSVRFYVNVTYCAALYTGTSYTGSRWSVRGPQAGSLINTPTGFNNAISSFRFGATWVDNGPDDRYCDGPWV